MSAEAGSGTNITSTTTVKTGPGRLLGIFASSSTSGTVKIYDGTSTSGTLLVNTATLAAATFYRIPVNFAVGLHVVVGGTLDCCVIWAAD